MSATVRLTIGELALTGDSYLRLALRGNWTAIVEVATGTVPAFPAPVTLAILPDAQPNKPPPVPALFSGTLRFARQVPGSDTLVMRIVGGAGKLFGSTPPASQVTGATQLTAGLVLRKIVDAAGEVLAAGVEDALDAYALPRWHRAGGMSARDAIDMLVYDVASYSGVALGWRMLQDGTIWAGIDTYPAATGSFVYTEQQPDDGVMTYAPSGAPLFPGTTIGTDQAIEVFYLLAAAKLRANVRHAVPGDPQRVAAQVATDLYRASYAARVESQRSDGTLDIVCDDARMGEMLAVPFKLGSPGVSVTIPRGSRVRVRFEGASPRGAYASDMDQDTTATEKFALVSDLCCYLSGTVAAAPGPVTFVTSPVPTGVPGEVKISIAGPGHKYASGVHG